MGMPRGHGAQKELSAESGGTVPSASEKTSLCFPGPPSLPASALKKNILFIPGRSKPLLLSSAKEINHTAPESSAFSTVVHGRVWRAQLPCMK